VGRSASPKDGSASLACLCLWSNPLHSWKSSTVVFVVSIRLWALCAAPTSCLKPNCILKPTTLISCWIAFTRLAVWFLLLNLGL
jgi:hypothetical protein